MKRFSAATMQIATLIAIPVGDGSVHRRRLTPKMLSIHAVMDPTGHLDERVLRKVLGGSSVTGQQKGESDGVGDVPYVEVLEAPRAWLEPVRGSLPDVLGHVAVLHLTIETLERRSTSRSRGKIVELDGIHDPFGL